MPNKLYIYNNIHVLRGLDDNSVDLIACDPPFNSNENYNSTVTKKAKGNLKIVGDGMK